MNEHGNRYAEAALKHRRAKIAGEVNSLRKQIREKLKQLETLDATLRILDPDYKEGSIKPKRYVRPPLFSHGELGRLILDALREANGTPMAAHQIAAVVREKSDMPESARLAITSRVNSGLTYLKQQGRVAKTGHKLAARWTLAP
jgi:hypothetical protein